MKVKVKTINLVFYTICVVILPTRADVEENENQSAESNYHSLESTVLPVPLALQMLTTTESAKEAEHSTYRVENPIDAAYHSKPETEISEGNETQEEPSVDGDDKSSEIVSEPNAVDAEQKPQEAEEETVVNTGKEESEPEAEKVEDVEQNTPVEQATEEKENPEDKEPAQTSTEEVQPNNGDTQPITTAVAEVEEAESKPAIEAVDGEQGSVDYPADAPAMNEDKEELENTNDSTNNETIDKDKGAESKGDVEQNAMTDKPEHESGGEAEKRPEGGVMQNTGNTAATTATNSVSSLTTNTMAPTQLGQILTCYSCESSTDAHCSAGPGKPINCQAIENKPNGCYTLYKADINTTTRGCLSELTEAGFKYCQSNVKLCIFCHKENCNNLVAPSAGVQISSAVTLWLGFGSFICLKFFL